MPLFPAKKEVYEWISKGEKTIDVRKGKPRRGDIAVFQSGAHYLRLPIVKKETGKLAEIIRPDNYKLIIPTAQNLDAAVDYLRSLYGADGGVFTAYYVVQPKQ
jgi:ASC-1-like (ASCH) protein